MHLGHWNLHRTMMHRAAPINESLWSEQTATWFRTLNALHAFHLVHGRWPRAPIDEDDAQDYADEAPLNAWMTRWSATFAKAGSPTPQRIAWDQLMKVVSEWEIV
jgi:hypothetical protein